MQLITISGLDGSGKSTQIKILKDYLEQKSFKVFYFHAIEFSLANKIAKKNKNESPKSVTQASFLKIFLRRFFLMIDLIRFRSLMKKLKNENFDYIVSDRYFYDSVVNINYLAKNETVLPCEKFIKKPTLAFYLRTNPENIMQRKRVPDQGLEYLKKKKELYDNRVVSWNLKIIDGDNEKNAVFENIKTHL